MGAKLSLTPAEVRRLAVTSQRLAGPPPVADRAAVLDIVRQLRCLQLDPISVVARTQLLVLWSRLGQFDPALLEELLAERTLFEYWAHCASLVLTEDYQIHAWMMRGYLDGSSVWASRQHDWLTEHAELRAAILERLGSAGPLLAQELVDLDQAPRRDSRWSSGRVLHRMLDHLWFGGEIMVADRQGTHRRWDVADRCLPPWTPRDELSEREVVRRAAAHALRALGVARPQQIRLHFTRGRYPALAAVIKELVAEGEVLPVKIAAAGAGWGGGWLVHRDTLPLLERLRTGGWATRTTLLSPFDNLICDRQRTELVWDFRFRIEIYVPAAQRQYGYYVLPILHGDTLIGRVDAAVDRKASRLVVKALYAEPGAPDDPATGAAVGAALAGLAQFVGAATVDYAGVVPAAWAAPLRGATL